MTKVSDLILLELVLERPGATDAELGTVLGLSRVAISRRKNSAKFKSLLQNYFRESFAIFKTARAKAARRICRAMDSADERVALKASELVCELLKEVPPANAEESSSTLYADVFSILKKRERDRVFQEASQKKFNETGIQLLTDQEKAEIVNGLEKKTGQ